MTPLVSIIIPTYNRVHLITETLDSILEQTYTNWECLVIDDGSTDNTAELLLQYCANDKRFQYYLRPKNRLKGANTCRNLGFELSKGNYINWFDDDDLMLNDFIAFKVLNIKPQHNFIITSGIIVDENKNKIKDLRFNNANHIYKQFCLYESSILTPSVLFTRDFLQKKNLFNPTIYRGQESEFFSRLFFNVNYNEYTHVDHKSFLYRQHEETKTYLNKSYVPIYKESLAFIYLENFKRAIILKDLELFKYYYKHLIYILFDGIKNNDIKNCNSILMKWKKPFIKINRFLYLQIYLITKLCLFLKTPSHKLKNYLLNKGVKINHINF